MSDFMEMVRDSANNGGNEQTMWKAVEVANDMLCGIKDAHPEKYNEYLRKMNEVLFGNHYGKAIACEDVSKMRSQAEDGTMHTGEHWTADDIELNTDGMDFPEGTTRWDKYVAFNDMWHKLHHDFSDGDIIKIAHKIFFSEHNNSGACKVWSYMANAK